MNDPALLARIKAWGKVLGGQRCLVCDKEKDGDRKGNNEITRHLQTDAHRLACLKDSVDGPEGLRLRDDLIHHFTYVNKSAYYTKGNDVLQVGKLMLQSHC